MLKSLENLRTSITGKILVIGFLVLILLIPMNMVESVINDRSAVYRSAEAGIVQSWGKEVTLQDPILTIEQQGQLSQSNWAYTYDYQYKHLAPEKLSISGHIETEIRERGIFKIPVYAGRIILKGYFTLPETHVKGSDARFQLLLNPRSLSKPPELIWGEENITMTAEKIPNVTDCALFTATIKHINTGNKALPFLLYLDLDGSHALSFQTLARESDIHITSNWNSPGFFGATLPTTHNINDDGFSADWKSSNLFQDQGHEENLTISPDMFPQNMVFGVNLYQAVDTYQLVTRAIKYAVLFLTLLFAVYLLYEFIGNIQIHPMQYLLIGFSNCIFYLLLLSLAEHIDFTLAYITSAFASSLLIALYSMSVLKSRLHGKLIFMELVTLYGFLYTTLQSEDYALLIGSMGLFTILSLIMYFTRNFNWYRTSAQSNA